MVLAVLAVALLLVGFQWRNDTSRAQRELDAIQREYYADQARNASVTLESARLKAENERLAAENATLKARLNRVPQVNIGPAERMHKDAGRE